MDDRVFNPDDFLTVAENIFEDASQFSNKEAALRTSVGRAYYSAFLRCKEFASHHGEIYLTDYDKPDCKRPGEVHAAVREALKEISLWHIANFLYRLFEMRVTSDYRLNETVNEKDASNAIKLCKKIIDDLEYR